MTIILAAIVLALATAAPQDASSAEGLAIEHVVAEHYGASTHLTSIVIDQSYALVRGVAGNRDVHDGLQLLRSGWKIVCSLGPADAHGRDVASRCGFPKHVAMQLAADEAVNAAVLRGDFSTAVSQEQIVYKVAAPEMRPSEAARLQYLDQLKRQMELGQITRAQAITKWNEVRWSWPLP